MDNTETDIYEADGQQDEGRALSDETILSIISNEMSNSTTGAGDEQEESLDYYLGLPRGDEQEGRSHATSTDVADAIEWILPQIIQSLIAKGPVVMFDAVNEGDEQQAALETAYTHDVFMKHNEGFLNLYEFVKGALMQKNGVFKVYYDDDQDVREETYPGITEPELMQLLQSPDVELTALMQEEEGAGTAPVATASVQITTDKGQVRVDCLAPEDFRVNKDHDSLNLDDARFTSHVRLRTRSELIEDGYNPDIIMQADPSVEVPYAKANRFAAQGEDVTYPDNCSEDPSQDLLEVAESYVMMDVQGVGVAERVQVVTLGSDDPTDLLEVTPVMSSPFVSSSCIIMPHKFSGLSIYDRLRQIQDMKTSLWRNILDNLYLQNNREKEVVENQVNLDDLLVSRPGGIKRVKAPGMIRELQVQPIGQEGYQMLDYLDTVRTGRVGVSPDTAGQVDALGTSVGSQGVARLMTAKEELVGLMVRVVAETGLKQSYKKIRDLLIEHEKSQPSFQFKGRWQQVDPQSWGDRSRTTVMVGTGTGDDARKVGAIQQVIAYQAELVKDPRNTLVEAGEMYSSLNEFCSVSGLGTDSPYFADPDSPEGQKRKQTLDQQNQQNQQKEMAMMQAQAQAQSEIAQGEKMKGEAAIMSQKAKLQIEQVKAELEHRDDMFEQQKAAYELKLKEQQARIDAMSSEQDRAYDYAKLEQDEALTLMEMELKYNQPKTDTDTTTGTGDGA